MSAARECESQLTESRFCLFHRNDDYLEKAGIPISSSIDFLFTEPLPEGFGDENEGMDEDGPASASDDELASDDPLELPPLSPKLTVAAGQNEDERVFSPR